MTTKKMRKPKKRKRAGIEKVLLPIGVRALAFFVFAGTGVGQIQPPATPQNGPTTTRSIEGVVTDAKRVPVSEAVVLLKDTKTLQVRSYLARKNGQYHFYGLSSDVNYELRAEREDMTSKPKIVSVFDSHKLVVLNLKLDKKKKP